MNTTNFNLSDTQNRINRDGISKLSNDELLFLSIQTGKYFMHNGNTIHLEDIKSAAQFEVRRRNSAQMIILSKSLMLATWALAIVTTFLVVITFHKG